MNLKVLLSIAAAYMTLVGIGMMFVPHQFGVGAVPADASPALIAFLRIVIHLGMAVAFALQWRARDRMSALPALSREDNIDA